MLQPDTFEALGDAVGQRLTRGEIEALCDLLDKAAEGCDYAADDLAERADYDRKHSDDEDASSDYTDASEAYNETKSALGDLIAQLRAGEERYRDA